MIEVKIREKCGECEGCGMVTHGDWDDFWKEHRRHVDIPGEVIDRWFRERGYSKGCWPPDEINCGECNGTGYAERWVPLAELRTMLEGKP